MKYLINESTDPYFNLAFDEYCLENIISDEPYFYLWRNRPAVIIGLNQNAYGEVNLDYLNSHGITLARRVTGGGAVSPALQNMDSAIIGKDPSPEIFAEALRKLGVDARTTGRNDIFVDGKKVSGFARRVSKNQEIIHGTMMYDVDIETLTKVLDVSGSKLQSKGIASVKSRVTNLKDYMPRFSSLDELQAALQDILADGDSRMELTPEQIAEVERMAKEKFATWEFIYGKSHEADFVQKEKLPCGTVEANISLYKGMISGLTFSGDYLFDAPSEELSARLVGIRYNASAIEEALSGIDISRYFRSTSKDEIIALLTRQAGACPARRLSLALQIGLQTRKVASLVFRERIEHDARHEMLHERIAETVHHISHELAELVHRKIEGVHKFLGHHLVHETSDQFILAALGSAACGTRHSNQGQNVEYQKHRICHHSSTKISCFQADTPRSCTTEAPSTCRSSTTTAT